MKNRINKIKELALKEMSEAKSLADLEKLRVKYLGRRSDLTNVLRGLKDLSKGERKEIGEMANKIKEEIESGIRNQESGIKKLKFSNIESREKIDTTYPGEKIKKGHLHPLTQVRYEIEEIFKSMGFLTVEGREVEDEFHNFDALNIPKDHPARDIWDTFWLKDGNLLQTHTSPMQIRFMKENKPPLRIIVPGRVFRYEASDATHESNFYQVEGLMVDESGKITVANFKSAMAEFMKSLFKREVKIRLRPSYFPFVEPGFEIDVSCPYCDGAGCRICKKTGWIEILGAGMVNQKVFTSVGFKKDKYEGFAFGFGLDRIAMIKYGVDDVRLFYSGDLRFLEQF
ncbi:phenylalanine--tRNA ligase subunit alpha [Candidatus Parcubacteria bacterium]|nr:phenylalanine--tRNA ligase subunit alpha [Candidatus Parcubacteria bacterium]